MVNGKDESKQYRIKKNDINLFMFCKMETREAKNAQYINMRLADIVVPNMQLPPLSVFKVIKDIEMDDNIIDNKEDNNKKEQENKKIKIQEIIKKVNPVEKIMSDEEKEYSYDNNKIMQNVSSDKTRILDMYLKNFYKFDLKSYPAMHFGTIDKYYFNEMKDDDYYVSKKIDGERCLLFNFMGRIYSYHRNNTYRQISQKDDIKYIEPFMIDAEFVEIDNIIYIVCFDNYQLSNKKKKFQERLKDMNILIDNVRKWNLIVIIVLQKYFLYKKKMEIDCHGLFRYDGYIFTHKDIIYSFGYVKSIKRWKVNNTIDFLVKRNEYKTGQYDLCVVGHDRFGDKYHKIFATTTENLDLYIDKIVECCFNVNEWRMMKMRLDKNSPNLEMTALEILLALKLPVKEIDMFS